MTLRHFRVFVAVCDTMNMTAAAQALFMSQSAVSQSVAELEKQYGVRLFERLSKKLYLTGAGEKLLGYARPLLRMSAEADRELRALGENETLRIGVSLTVGSCLLPRLAAAFRSQATGTCIEVTENNTRRIEQMILADQLDFGIVEGATSSPDVLTHPLMEDEMVPVCAPCHRFAGMPEVAPEALAGEDFIIREEGSGTRETFEKGMSGLPWHAAWVCNNADSIRMAVENNIGISVISRLSVARDLAAGLLCAVPVHSLRFTRTFQVIYHKNKFITRAMQTFMDFCEDYVQKSGPEPA